MTRNQNIILSIGVPILIFSILALSYGINNDIIGTWVSKEDPKSKWVFTSDSKIKKYYDNELLSTYIYEVYTSLPECEFEWENPNPNLKFLALKKINTEKKDCYVIYNLDEENLTLSRFGRGNFLTFERQ